MTVAHRSCFHQMITVCTRSITLHQSQKDITCKISQQEVILIAIATTVMLTQRVGAAPALDVLTSQGQEG
eukprot:5488852-Amphidinium_carterae.1